MHLNKLYFFLRNWNIWEKCGCSRKIQECGHADRHAAAHGRGAWASWRWVPCGRPLMVCVTLHAQGLCGSSQVVKVLKVQKWISDILAAFLLLWPKWLAGEFIGAGSFRGSEFMMMERRELVVGAASEGSVSNSKREVEQTENSRRLQNSKSSDVHLSAGPHLLIIQ